MDEKVIKVLKQGDFATVSIVEINLDGESKRTLCVKKELIRHVNCNEIKMLKALFGNKYICQMLYTLPGVVYMESYAGDLFDIQKPLGQEESLRIISECAEAIHAVHMIGFVHRDIKPENIFLDVQGTVKLGDFGSAVRLNSRVPGQISGGTPIYMAPEVLHRYGGVVTEVMDWWSLGIVLYELVTNRIPWGYDNCSMAEMCKAMEQVMPKTESAGCDELIEGLIVKDPNERFGYSQLQLFFEYYNQKKVSEDLLNINVSKPENIHLYTKAKRTAMEEGELGSIDELETALTASAREIVKLFSNQKENDQDGLELERLVSAFVYLKDQLDVVQKPVVSLRKKSKTEEENMGSNRGFEEMER